MKNLLLVSSIVVIFCSCNTTETTDKFAAVYNYAKQNNIQSIDLIPIVMDNIESSYVGDVGIQGNSIMFFDKKFCWIFFFNENGTYQRRLLGQGGGPAELNTTSIEGYTTLSDERILCIGAGTDIHIHDIETGKRVSQYTIDKGKSAIRTNYNSPSIYTMSYEKLIFRNFGDYLYYNVVCEHPDYNFFSNKRYFPDCRVLSQIDIKTGVVDVMIGSYPPIYEMDKSLKQFSLLNFDIDNNGNFFLSFESDSLIYKYSQEFKPTTTFGYSGTDMEENRNVLSSVEDFKRNYSSDRERCGYYTWLEYVDEVGILFRSYQRGHTSACDGMQLYKENKLIGDVDVPKGFRVIGYIYPYIYGAVPVNEENEIITAYKFRL